METIPPPPSASSPLCLVVARGIMRRIVKSLANFYLEAGYGLISVMLDGRGWRVEPVRNRFPLIYLPLYIAAYSCVQRFDVTAIDDKDRTIDPRM